MTQKKGLALRENEFTSASERQIASSLAVTSNAVEAKPVKRGFTLLELLVVLAIIGLMVTAAFASLGAAKDKGKIASTKSQLHQIENAFHLFNSKYMDIPPLPLHADFCNMCFYWPPSVPWAHGAWVDVVDALVAEGLITNDIKTDPWGNPYLYDKNYNMGLYTCNTWSPICSMGPNATLETPNCQALPVTNGDDICLFYNNE